MEPILSALPIFTQKAAFHYLLTSDLTIGRDFDCMKRKVMAYRLTFIFLGVLFVYLTAMLYFQTPNWMFHHLFKQETIAKDLLTGISALLSLVALWLGCHTRTSIELAKKYTNEATSRIKAAYWEMRTELSHESYQLALKKIDNHYQTTLEHLHRIQDLSLPELTKRKIKINHLKNLKDQLDEARIAI